MTIEVRIRHTGECITLDEYKSRHPNVSFPAEFMPDDVDVIHSTTMPVEPYKTAERDGVVLNGSGQWEHAWKLTVWTPEQIAAFDAAAAHEARETAKEARANAVAAITVTTGSGKVFDGDETSQNRMNRAITALTVTGTPTTVWVLADNTVTEVTAAELSEAMALAGLAQANMWVI